MVYNKVLQREPPLAIGAGRGCINGGDRAGICCGANYGQHGRDAHCVRQWAAHPPCQSRRRRRFRLLQGRAFRQKTFLFLLIKALPTGRGCKLYCSGNQGVGRKSFFIPRADTPLMLISPFPGCLMCLMKRMRFAAWCSWRATGASSIRRAPL